MREKFSGQLGRAGARQPCEGHLHGLVERLKCAYFSALRNEIETYSASYFFSSCLMNRPEFVLLFWGRHHITSGEIFYRLCGIIN